jgi:hypothetical protein
MKRLVPVALAFSLCTSHASAELFNFHFNQLGASYDGSEFSIVLDKSRADGDVQAADGTTADFTQNMWGSGNFALSMTIDKLSLKPLNATGSGTFDITDIDGDVIHGDLAGTWTNLGIVNVFQGTLSQVGFTETDLEFDGASGSPVSMYFGSNGSWSGEIFQMKLYSPWFTAGAFTSPANLDSLTGTVVPLPATVLIGLFGMGVTALKLRKYV